MTINVRLVSKRRVTSDSASRPRGTHTWLYYVESLKTQTVIFSDRQEVVLLLRKRKVLPLLIYSKSYRSARTLSSCSFEVHFDP